MLYLRYVLGEFGANCCDVAGMSGYDQFAALQAHLHRISPKVNMTYREWVYS